MDEFLEGRNNTEAYTVFFDLFVAYATKKTAWDRRLAQAQTNPERTTTCLSLCTVSDEAFALLLLENSSAWWLDIFANHKGQVMQRRGVKQRAFQSDVPTMYTRGGIKYDKTNQTQAAKGWSDEGITRFNELFDQVKQDRTRNPDFETDWLEARLCAQAADGVTPKKRKHQPPQARSELFDAEDDGNIEPTHDPVEESESETEAGSY